MRCVEGHALVLSDARGIGAQLWLHSLPHLLLVDHVRRKWFSWMTIEEDALADRALCRWGKKLNNCVLCVRSCEHHGLRFNALHLLRLEIAEQHGTAIGQGVGRHVWHKP